RAVAGDDAVTGRSLLVHAEVLRAGDGERIRLNEGAMIHQDLEALAGGELAPVVLLLRGVSSPRRFGRLPPPPELVDPLLDRGLLRGTGDVLVRRRHPRSVVPATRPATWRSCAVPRRRRGRRCAST